MVNLYVNGYTKTRNQRETLRKMQKNNLLKTKRIVNTKIQARRRPSFYI